MRRLHVLIPEPRVPPLIIRDGRAYPLEVRHTSLRSALLVQLRIKAIMPHRERRFGMDVRLTDMAVLDFFSHDRRHTVGVCHGLAAVEVKVGANASEAAARLEVHVDVLPV